MRDFFKYTFASLVSLLIFFGLGTSALLFLLITAAVKDTGPLVKDKSVLVFDMSVKINDTNPASGTGELIQKAVSGDDNQEVITLRNVLDAIERATQDKRIVAIYLDASDPSAGGIAGFATLKEVRKALEQFKAAGKKIIAYNVAWDEPTYYLASVANTIVVNPMGMLEMNGLRSETMFWTGAFEKYGIGVQVIRVGKYKSAVEPYLLKQLSSENRNQSQKLLGDIWGEFRTVVGKSRKLTPQQVQAIADNKGLLMAQEAFKNKLVDRVAYYDGVVSDLKELTGNDKEDKSFRQISLATYAKVPDSAVGRERKSKNKIGVIYAEGEIVNGQGGIRQVGGDRLADRFRQMRLDDNVKAVVLRVNSPGGSATASEIIQREVRLTRQAKPVIVSMGDVAASGGYWISTYANRIFAESNTITGSIGVFGLLPNVQKLANNNGITWDVVKTGRYADSETISRPKTPQELEIYQGSVNQIYSQFVGKVAQSRKLPTSRVQEIAQGRVWSGFAAKQIGLVDEIGGMESAIDYAAKAAKLNDDWELKEFSRSRSLEEKLVKNLFGSSTNNNEGISKTKQFDPLSVTYEKLREDLSILQNLNDPLGVYARLPYNFHIK